MKIIYKATNIINKKSYIGQTIKNFEWYKNNHINKAIKKVDIKFHNERAFYRAIRKYGKDNFEWKILWEGKCSNEWLDDLEKYYIYFYQSFGSNGYNMTIGGEEGWKKSINNSPNRKEIYKKRGKSLSKYLNKIDGETGLTMAQKRAKKQSKTIKNNGSVAGKKNPMYGRKRSGTNAGRKTKYLLISPNGQLIGAYGNLRAVCKKYNLGIIGSIRHRINKGIIEDGETKKFKNRNIIGWEILRIE
jgi:group I intron endonuclease